MQSIAPIFNDPEEKNKLICIIVLSFFIPLILLALPIFVFPQKFSKTSLDVIKAYFNLEVVLLVSSISGILAPIAFLVHCFFTLTIILAIRNDKEIKIWVPFKIIQ